MSKSTLDNKKNSYKGQILLWKSTENISMTWQNVHLWLEKNTDKTLKSDLKVEKKLLRNVKSALQVETNNSRGQKVLSCFKKTISNKMSKILTQG